MKFLELTYMKNTGVGSRGVTDYLNSLLSLGNELVYTDDFLN